MQDNKWIVVFLALVIVTFLLWKSHDIGWLRLRQVHVVSQVNRSSTDQVRNFRNVERVRYDRFAAERAAASIPAKSGRRRAPNMDEYFYAGFATHTDSPKACYKISPLAVTSAMWAPKGSQIASLRSECLVAVAVKTGALSLCDDVIEIKAPFLDGSRISPRGCREQIRERSGHPAEWGLEMGRLRTALQQMGYTKDAMPAKYRKFDWMDPEEVWFDYFFEVLRKSPDLQGRLDRLPSYE